LPLLQLTLEIGGRDPGPFEDLLLEGGALSVTLEDAADDPVLEPAPGETPLWPTLRIKALFEDEPGTGRVIDDLRRRLPPELPFAVEPLPDKPWEREWLKDFRPMRFGRRLWVCPGGQAAGAEHAVVIELDPGLAFGTGTHPTTAMCLEWLDQLELEGKALIDYGCGSGILAIAALKLGASRAMAIDIDPQALIATRENAARNAVANLELGGGQELGNASADALVANILAGPLVELAPQLAAAVKPGGAIALSGILIEQAPAVTAAYQPWFDIGLAATRDSWGLLSGRRRTG
jgi:ribosomal protein L11 methyltransferase